jgi:ABC-2 type transport system permease protein
MFADAFRSEAYRLLRNRTVVFWAFLFAPMLGLIASLGQTFFIRSQTSKITQALPELNGLNGGALDLGRLFLNVVGDLSNPALLLFTLIAAATVFAGDYRWETWRLISARNSRANLILGKVGVLIAAAGAALLIYFCAVMTAKIIEGLAFGRSLTFSLASDEMRLAAGLAGLAWLRMVQFLMASLLAAVVTRSLLAALFIPLVIGVGQTILAGVAPMLGLAPDGWAMALEAMLLGERLGASGPLLKAWTGVALWTLGPIALAMAWFQRQNLSKE